MCYIPKVFLLLFLFSCMPLNCSNSILYSLYSYSYFTFMNKYQTIMLLAIYYLFVLILLWFAHTLMYLGSLLTCLSCKLSGNLMLGLKYSSVLNLFTGVSKVNCFQNIYYIPLCSPITTSFILSFQSIQAFTLQILLKK